MVAKTEMTEVIKMSMGTKIRICYLGFIENYGSDAVENLEDYYEQTYTSYMDDCSDFVFNSFEDFINRLTYSHLNGIFGTPYSLV